MGGGASAAGFPGFAKAPSTFRVFSEEPNNSLRSRWMDALFRSSSWLMNAKVATALFKVATTPSPPTPARAAHSSQGSTYAVSCLLARPVTITPRLPAGCGQRGFCQVFDCGIMWTGFPTAALGCGTASYPRPGTLTPLQPCSFFSGVSHAVVQQAQLATFAIVDSG